MKKYAKKKFSKKKRVYRKKRGFIKKKRVYRKKKRFAKRVSVKAAIAKELMVDNVMVLNYLTTRTTSVGQQQPYSPSGPGTPTYDAIGTIASICNPDCMMNPNLYPQMEAQILAGTSTTNPPAFRAFVREWKIQYRVLNGKNTPVRIQRYRLVARKDIPTQRGRATATTATVSLANFITLGETNAIPANSGQVSTAITSSAIGWTPFMNPLLTQLFKMKPLRPITLGAGEERAITRKFRPKTPYTVNAAEYEQDPLSANTGGNQDKQGVLFLKKGFSTELWIATGGIVAVADNSNSVGYDAAKFFVATTLTVHWSYISENQVTRGGNGLVMTNADPATFTATRTLTEMNPYVTLPVVAL